MRRKIVVMVLALVLMACTTGTDEATTTSTVPVEEPSAISTTTLVDATTTTVDPETASSLAADAVVPLNRFDSSTRPLTLEPEVTYVHDLLVPFEIRLSEAGWSAVWIGERGIALTRSSTEGPVSAFVSIKPFTPDQVIASLVENEKISESTESSPVSVGGATGVTFDVLVNGVNGGQIGPGCIGPLVVEERYPNGGGWAQDLVGCAWNRVWVVEAGGATVVLHIAVDTRDPEERPTLTGIEPLIDEFLAAITFEP